MTLMMILTIVLGWGGDNGRMRLECYVTKKNPVSLKGRVYHVVVRPVLFYGVECWPVNKTQVQRLTVTEMRMIW